ncbi:MAG: hypothetical protein FWD82_00010 [Defluviitaleaceae bacterium]|nr:hypothetical protein [Defluviitaleaceae bacterium]
MEYLEKFVEKAFNEKPFKEWAEKNEIELIPKVPQPQHRKTKRFVLRYVSVAASLILLSAIAVLSIILPLTPDVTYPSTIPDLPRIYTEEDAISQNITLDYLYQIEHLILFNREQIQNENNGLEVTRYVVKYEEDFLLGYTLAPISFVTLDGQNTFLINFRIRVHRYFMFREYERFNNFTQNITNNNINLYFHILENNQALARFEYNDIEYFLTITCFYEQDITDDSLTMIFRDLTS